MAGGLGEEADPILDGAAFRIGRPEVKAPDARKGDRGGAHGAGLECHVKVAADQALVAKRLASRADGEKLRMGGGITKRARAVSRGGDHRAFLDDDGADRHLASDCGRSRLLERKPHWIRPRRQLFAPCPLASPPPFW